MKAPNDMSALTGEIPRSPRLTLKATGNRRLLGEGKSIIFSDESSHGLSDALWRVLENTHMNNTKEAQQV